MNTARVAKDRLGALLVVGILAGFTFQVIYNVTMSAGMAPVKGLTLPLMSYGGSSLIATLAAFGLILNVRMRRFTELGVRDQGSGIRNETVDRIQGEELRTNRIRKTGVCKTGPWLVGRSPHLGSLLSLSSQPDTAPERNALEFPVMTKEMIISSNGHETMVAILEDDLVSEVYVERERQRGVVGNVYKGRVSKVLPGMQSAFVDIGIERDGFLYVSDVVDTLDAFEKMESGDEEDEDESRGTPR